MSEQKLEPWMVPWMWDLAADVHDHLMRNPEAGKKNLAKLEQIIAAIEHAIGENDAQD